MSEKTQYIVYILECGDGSLYTGVTTDLERRVAEHADGRGSKYTRAKGVRRVVYTEECVDRSSAQQREAAIKKLTHQQKSQLIRIDAR